LAEGMRGMASMVRAMDVAMRPFAEGLRRLRSVAERISAVRETEKALIDLPRSSLRRLAMITMRCSGKDNHLLVRVVRIPRYLPGARYDRYLVMPSASATYAYGDQRITEPAWFLSDLKSFDVQCRCHHRPVTLTRDHLRGESPPPSGVRCVLIRESVY